MMESRAPIYIAGHGGMAGSAVHRELLRAGYSNLLVAPREELDLTRQEAVEAFFAHHRPEALVLAAARVGGILANATRPLDFVRDNLLIQTHTLDAALRHGVRRIVFFGSSCIYPRQAPQPIREEHLLTGPLEETNRAYALAKIAGVEVCRSAVAQQGVEAVCPMPTNLYGPGDTFDPESSHVLPALLLRFRRAVREGAPQVTLWGSGSPRREFLHVDDLARAVRVLLEQPWEELKRAAPDTLVNVGFGEDIPILELAELIAELTGFQGEIELDRSRPDGTPRKLLDSSRMRLLGWSPSIGLREGIEATLRWMDEQNIDEEQTP